MKNYLTFLPLDVKSISDLKYINNLENICKNNLKDKNPVFNLRIRSVYILKRLYDYTLLNNIQDIKYLLKLVETVSILYEYRFYNDDLNNTSSHLIEFDQKLVKFLNDYWDVNDIHLIFSLLENISFKKEQKLRSICGKYNKPYNFDIELGDVGSLARDIVSDASKLQITGIYGLNYFITNLKINRPNLTKNNINQQLLKYFNEELKILHSSNYFRTIPGQELARCKYLEMKEYFNTINVVI